MERKMKYVRFQGLEKTKGIPSQRGIFQLAYQLKHSPEIYPYDDRELRKNLLWLDTHLKAPDVLDKPKHYRAIFWFKDGAIEPLKRIRAIKFVLEQYDIWVDQVTTTNPGYIIYQDGWQVAAKPFRNGKKGAKNAS